MKQFFQFTWYPALTIPRAITLKDKLRTLSGSLKALFLLIFIAGIVVTVFSIFYKYLTNVDFHKDIILSQNDYLKEYAPVIYYAIIIIGAPVFEEFTYRLYLNPTRITLAAFSSLAFFHFTVSIWYYESYTAPVTYLLILIAIIIFPLIYYSLNNQFINILGGKYFRLLFYFSALLFGFMHLMNFVPLNFQKIILSPLIVLSQIIYGFLLGYIRVKNGLLWSMILHSIINSIACVIELFGLNHL